MVKGDADIAKAYDSCERTARAHYENFPVASLLIPARMRRHVAAVYAFARAADDFADEGRRSAADRLALLDRWEVRLHTAVTGGQSPSATPEEPANTLDIFRALGVTIKERALPVELFEDLLRAFRQDVTVHRYDTWLGLLDYCRHSANPVGRLVLRIAGHHDAGLDSWSDCVCTALQLTNFWQDLRIDFDRGRVYVPAEVVRAHGASIDDLARAMTPAWKSALADVADRTRIMFAAGRPLCDAITGRLRYELRATWLGGMRILDRLHAEGYDPLSRRPALGAGDVAWLALRVCTWPPSR